MRNRLYIVFFSLLLQSIVAGQTVLNNSIFPMAGDVQTLLIDLQPGIFLTPPSTISQEWDFSVLESAQERQDTFFSASSGAFFSAFPTADMIHRNEQGREEYIQVNQNQMVVLGYVQELFGSAFPVVYESPVVRWQVPLAYGGAFSHTNEAGFSVGLDDYPLIDSLLNSIGEIGGIVDSLRLLTIIETNKVADAWGQCLMPNGHYFDVLRVKETVSTETVIEVFVKIGPLGIWLDLSEFIEDLDATEFEVANNYEFVTNNNTGFLVKLFSDTDNNVIRAEFKNEEITSASYEPFAKSNIIHTIFPNPGDDLIYIKMEKGEKLFQLQIIDLWGKTVIKQFLNLNQDDTFEISTEQLPPATYIYLLLDQNGALMTSGKLIIGEG